MTLVLEGCAVNSAASHFCPATLSVKNNAGIRLQFNLFQSKMLSNSVGVHFLLVLSYFVLDPCDCFDPPKGTLQVCVSHLSDFKTGSW